MELNVEITDVAAAATPKHVNTFLTHAVVLGTLDRVLCNAVKLSNLLMDTCSEGARNASEPTCTTCKRNLDQLRTEHEVTIVNIEG